MTTAATAIVSGRPKDENNTAKRRYAIKMINIIHGTFTAEPGFTFLIVVFSLLIMHRL